MGQPVEGSAAPGLEDIRFEPRREDCAVLEASTPELDDVVRLEDRYGRA